MARMESLSISARRRISAHKAMFMASSFRCWHRVARQPCSRSRLASYGDGRPYYAMRFIRGDSLKEAIEGFHAEGSWRRDPGRRTLELHKLLLRFVDVCNAIDYAHSRGVLHRDLKPGNIIVGRHGETLVVDWGLAKATGQSDPATGERTLMPSSASGSAETLPGSALGTPSYMSPEQAEGQLDRLGPRSDVYSLGATLYCLLTGGPPFEGDVADVIRAVQRGDFRPPRQLDSAIDTALEAVCLKAMALKPEDRYGSCRALAEDIERWMADEPLSAFRDGPSRRLGRWMRRHRAAAQAGAVALVLIAVVATGAALLIDRARQATARALVAEQRARAAEEEARLHADEQRRLAESRLRLAGRAVDDMYINVAEKWIALQPHLEPLHREFLEKARDIFLELAKDS